MTPTRHFDAVRISREQRFDVAKMLADRDNIALLLVCLPPLVVIVEDERNYVVEVGHEPVSRGVNDEPVEPLIQVGEIVKAGLYLAKQAAVFCFDFPQRFPCWRIY